MQTPPEKFPFWEVPRTGLKCSNFSDLIVDKYAINLPIWDIFILCKLGDNPCRPCNCGYTDCHLDFPETDIIAK